MTTNSERAAARPAIDRPATDQPGAELPVPEPPLTRPRHPVVRWLAGISWPLGALALILCVWAISNAVLRPPAYLYPSPGAVWEELTLGGRSILASTLITLMGAAWAFLLAAVMGAVVALALSAIPLLYKSLFPYTVLIQTIPVIAVAPIIIIYFGIGLPSIVVIALIIAIFPVIANTTVGLRSTDASMQQLFTLYGRPAGRPYSSCAFPTRCRTSSPGCESRQVGPSSARWWASTWRAWAATRAGWAF